jgi:hypothetical protein
MIPPGGFVIFQSLIFKTTIMKWEIVLSTTELEVYELWHHERKLLTLNFHPFTNSARIEYADEKRVFLIRKEGFRRNKTVLRNEYGIRIGQLGSDNSTTGTLELNNEKFFYNIQNDPSGELVIYKESIDQPFVVCGLKPNDGNPGIVLSKNNKLKPSQHFLLMALCWYMFLPVAKESMVEYAS